MLVCWCRRFDWSFVHLIAPVVTTTFIVLSSKKIQNGDILVLANRGSAGKRPLKQRERERVVSVMDSRVITWIWFLCWWHQERHKAKIDQCFGEGSPIHLGRFEPSSGKHTMLKDVFYSSIFRLTSLFLGVTMD